MKPTIIDALADVAEERVKQDEKWGEQNHPYFGGSSQGVARDIYEEESVYLKGLNDLLVESGKLGFDTILLEEVYEALAETDPVKQREEMVQVAAVAVCIIEAIDRAAG